MKRVFTSWLPALCALALAACDRQETNGESSKRSGNAPGTGTEPAPTSVPVAPEGSLEARPLATRSESVGETLFQRLAPEQTGVAFRVLHIVEG